MIRKFLIIGIVAVASLIGCKANAEDYSKLYERNIEGVYSIQYDTSSGTAWQLEENVFVTASHVVNNEDGSDAVGLTITGNDLIREEWPINVIYDDPSRDLAILSMKPETWESFKKAENPFNLPLAAMGSNRPGQPVWGIGNREGQYGYLYSGNIAITAQWMFGIQHAVMEFLNVAIIPGDSGGPVFNMKGEVMGSASSFYYFEAGQTNNGQVVSVDSIWKLLVDLESVTKQDVVALPMTVPANYIELKSWGSHVVNAEYEILMVDPNNQLFKDMELQIGDHDIIVKTEWTSAISSKPYLIESPMDMMAFAAMLIPGEEVTILLTRKSGVKFSKKFIIKG